MGILLLTRASCGCIITLMNYAHFAHDNMTGNNIMSNEKQSMEGYYKQRVIDTLKSDRVDVMFNAGDCLCDDDMSTADQFIAFRDVVDYDRLIDAFEKLDDGWFHRIIGGFHDIQLDD